MTLISNKIFHDNGYFLKGNRKLFFCSEPGTRDALYDINKCTGLLLPPVYREPSIKLLDSKQREQQEMLRNLFALVSVVLLPLFLASPHFFAT